VPPADVWLVAAATTRDDDAWSVSRYTATVPGHGEVVLVDATTANARGRLRYGPTMPRGALALGRDGDDVRWRILTGRDRIVVAGRAGNALTDAQRDVLARLGAVDVAPPAADAGGEVDARARAAVLAQLAMTGVVLHGATDAEPFLDAELTDLLRAPLPGPTADPVTWELRSIVQRRSAMRRHATDIVVAGGSGSAFPAAPPPVTALLMTRRPHLLARAVAELCAQTYPSLQIVVGLHGVDVAPDDRARLRETRVPIELVPVPADRRLGEALAALTVVAGGSLITKVDDDDRYGPDHVWDLVLARQYSNATVVGKAAEFVHLGPYNATVRRNMDSELYADAVAGGTILLSRGDLEQVGGWRPLARGVDRALLDRVLADGGLLYRTHGFGFVYTRHTEGHTWDPGLKYFLLNPGRIWPGLPPYAEFGQPTDEPTPTD
jgi:hypothetical protein